MRMINYAHTRTQTQTHQHAHIENLSHFRLECIISHFAGRSTFLLWPV